MFRQVRWFSYVLVVLLCSTSLSFAQSSPQQRVEKRVALVIGVAAYEHQNPLQATTNDSRDMAALLRSRGFTLVNGGPLQNPTKQQMEQAIRAFTAAAADADVALFYFSGHGTQALGRNWMLPRDTPRGRQESEAQLTMIDTELVVQQMAAAKVKLGILIFDACRNNAYNPTATVRAEPRSGFVEMRAPPGMLIAFATEPGALSGDGPANGNSPYTRHLLRAMQQPGQDLLRVFNTAAIETRRERPDQTPWLALSPLERDFHFTPANGQAPTPVAPSQPQTSQAPRVPPVAPATTPAATTGDPSFYLLNLSNRRITQVMASLSTDSQWGANRLNNTVLAHGHRLGLQFRPGSSCEVDLRLVFEDGTTAEHRRVNTCPHALMVLMPQGRLMAANADFMLVNGTGRPLRDIRASFGSDNQWGDNRLPAGTVLEPGGRLPVRLPRGVDCMVDIIAVPTTGAPVQRRGQQLCTSDSFTLQ